MHGNADRSPQQAQMPRMPFGLGDVREARRYAPVPHLWSRVPQRGKMRTITHKESMAKWLAKPGSREKAYAASRDWLKRHPEKNKQYKTNDLTRHEAQYKARGIIFRAVRAGTMKAPENCTGCSLPKKLQAHHPDYNKPLDVIWLCSRCHKLQHKIEASNA